MRLTAFLNDSDHAEYTRKAILQKMKASVTIIERFMQTGINFVLGKNGGQTTAIIFINTEQYRPVYVPS